MQLLQESERVIRVKEWEHRLTGTVGCPRKYIKPFSVRTGKNRNSICFGRSVCFMKPKNNFSFCFGVSNMYRYLFETNRNFTPTGTALAGGLVVRHAQMQHRLLTDTTRCSTKALVDRHSMCSTGCCRQTRPGAVQAVEERQVHVQHKVLVDRRTQVQHRLL